MDEEQKEEVKLQKIDRIFVLSFCGVLILVMLFLLSLTGAMERFHEVRILGPGAFPFVLFIITIGLTIWLVIQVLIGKGSSAKLKDHIDLKRLKKPLFLYGRVFFAVVLLQFIGFLLSMMIFTFVEMKFFSEKKLKLPLIIICSIILPVTVYVGFYFLNINLPSPAWLPF